MESDKIEEVYQNDFFQVLNQEQIQNDSIGNICHQLGKPGDQGIEAYENNNELTEIEIKQKSISTYQKVGSKISFDNYQLMNNNIIIPSFHKKSINNPIILQKTILNDNQAEKEKHSQIKQLNLPALKINNFRRLSQNQRESISSLSNNNKYTNNYNKKNIINTNASLKNSRKITVRNLGKLQKIDNKQQPRSKSINYDQKLTQIQTIKKDFVNGIKLPNYSLVKIPTTIPKRQIRKTTQTFKQRQLCLKQFFSSSDILQNYKILSHIGKGSFSIVSLAIQSLTKKRFAIKTYIKIDQIQFFKFQNIQRQIQNLFSLNHKNIVNLQHAVQDKRKILLIMEDAGKQSLAGLLRKFKTFDEMAIKLYLKQILEGLNYCHQKKICHRDLKLENILVDERNNIKIIDFGFSIDSSIKLNTFCGTPPYMAPEVTLKVLYNGPAADIWSLGVIVYMMTYGKFPFRANNEKQLYRIIQQGKINHIDQKSIQLKQIINKMMKVDVKQRATAEQLLKNTWFLQ